MLTPDFLEKFKQQIEEEFAKSPPSFYSEIETEITPLSRSQEFHYFCILDDQFAAVHLPASRISVSIEGELGATSEAQLRQKALSAAEILGRKIESNLFRSIDRATNVSDRVVKVFSTAIDDTRASGGLLIATLTTEYRLNFQIGDKIELADSNNIYLGSATIIALRLDYDSDGAAVCTVQVELDKQSPLFTRKNLPAFIRHAEAQDIPTFEQVMTPLVVNPSFERFSYPLEHLISLQFYSSKDPSEINDLVIKPYQEKYPDARYSFLCSKESTPFTTEIAASRVCAREEIRKEACFLIDFSTLRRISETELPTLTIEQISDSAIRLTMTDIFGLLSLAPERNVALYLTKKL